MYKSQWHRADLSTIVALPNIRQVYIWVFDQDHNVVIVSKDGDKWQMPGGKPDPNETIFESATRELFEETGIALSEEEQPQLVFFGFYDYQEFDEANKLINEFQQVRSLITLNSSAIKDAKPNEPEGLDPIKFVKIVPINEIAKYIPWMPETGEYKYIVDKIGK